jgi:hypothetical protein
MKLQSQPFLVQYDLRKTGRVSHSGFQWTFIAVLAPQVRGEEGLGGQPSTRIASSRIARVKMWEIGQRMGRAFSLKRKVVLRGLS